MGSNNILDVDFTSKPSQKTQLKPKHDLRRSYIEEAQKLVFDLVSRWKKNCKSAKECISFQNGLRWAVFDFDSRENNVNFSLTKCVVDPSP